jgi:5S rRNA maturation endonuclease (ribonuclease M5)
MQIADLVRQLDAKQKGDGWIALCPAHEDHDPSLSIGEGKNGRILLKCLGGCDVKAVLERLGLTFKDLYPAGQSSERKIVHVYVYTDEKGVTLFEVCRTDPKDFICRRPDGKGGWIWNIKGVRRVLYHLPQLLDAETVIITEGERDADNLAVLGFVTTTNPGGAGKWRKEYGESLRGKDVVAIADNDESGERHVEQVARSLCGMARTIKILRLPKIVKDKPVKDVTDFIFSLLPPDQRGDKEAQGKVAEEISRLIHETPTWTPEKAPAHQGDDETIKRLAPMSVLEYERVRSAEAKKLRCRESVLDRLVNAERLLANPANDSLQGTTVTLADVEPWPDPVNGAVVLDEISKRLAQYVVMPPGAADVIALWIAHTHCFRAFMHTPRLNVSSAEKDSGKTTLRDVCAELVARPLLTENLTTAVLFRLIHAQSPSVLADEYDAWLKENEELRGLLNAGHRRGGIIPRCEGEGFEVRGFTVFAPVMLCGIGVLPGTLHDRSIVIRLARAKRGEIPTRFDSRHVEVEDKLRRKLARWVSDNRARIEAIDPVLPENMFNRMADNWRPLSAIAQIAGGDWPGRCVSAYGKLHRNEFEDVESLRVALLTDIQKIFATLADERIFSKSLCEQLAEMKERPWPEVRKGGKPITERWLAYNLAAFGIKSKNIRIKDKEGEERQAKGYETDDFKDTFERYVMPN